MESGLIHRNSLDRPISSGRVSVLRFTEINVFNANIVDPDQTLRSAMTEWVYTVYQCTFYGTPGINGFKFKQFQLTGDVLGEIAE